MQAAKIGYFIAGLIMVLAAFLTYSYGVEAILFFLFLAGMCFYLVFSKEKIPSTFERYAEIDREIDSLPPEQRKDTAKVFFFMYSLVLYLLSGTILIYVIDNYDPLSERFITEFLSDPITPILLLSSFTCIVAGELLRRTKKLGGFFAIASTGLLIISQVLFVVTDKTFQFWFVWPLIYTGLIPLLYKFWKDLKPLRFATNLDRNQNKNC